MRKVALWVIALVVAFGVPSPVSANPLATKKFKSCSELWMTYPNGVARSAGESVRMAMDGYAQPSSRPKIYRLNRHLDPTRSGVACIKTIPGGGASLEGMFDSINCRNLARLLPRDELPAYCAQYGY